MANKQFNSVDGYSIGNATVVVDANANITAAKLTANGNVSFTGSNVSLGAVGNLKITGGTSGYYLQTDGSGNLSWQQVSVSTASISNGNSNVNIPAANGNVQVSVAGVANVITFTSNNAYRGSYGLTGAIFQANTAPSNPQPGDQWYNTYNGILFEYLDDGTTSQWVDISSIPYPNVIIANASAVLNNVQTTGTYYPAFISSTANGNYSLNSNTAFSANLANGALIATTFVGALSGAATSATTAGTVTTAAQPNITSVGTLSSLAITGNVAAGNANVTGQVISTVATGTAPLVVTSTTRVANLNVAYANVSDYSTSGSALNGNFYLTLQNSLSANVQSLGNSAFIANASNGALYATTFVGTLSGAATTAGTVTTAAQPNITSVGTLSSLTVTANVSAGNLSTGGELSVTGNALITGNLSVQGNLIYINTETLTIEDPIIQLQTGPNGAAPTSNSGKDVGTALNYYDTQARVAFMGWDVSNVEFGLASQASITNEVVTFSTYGNLRVGNIIGNGQALTAINGSNVTGTVSSATTAGTVTTAAQPNITSVGTLSSLTVSGALTTTQITTGANTTAGNITGNWTLTAGSRLQATYADLAEYYVADKDYEPGTVLMFGGEQEVTIAEDGTNRVAGVVTTNPAYIMNTDCPGNKVAIALQGRVPVKVRGKISKGDMMVSGGNGFARPNQFPTIGTVIGKALENFDGYEGIIEVAVGRF